MDRSLRIFCFLLAILCIDPSALVAQVPTRNPDPTGIPNPIGSSEIRDTTASEVLPLDTPVAMAYVLITDPGRVITLPDTFSWDDNDHDPMRAFHAHLGNYGSPSRSLLPYLKFVYGFNTGWDQYDPYFIHRDSFRFFTQQVPVAKIKFSQSGQDDNYLTLDFGRRFAKGMSLSLTYNKINQLGKYGHQRQINSALGIGVWHDAPNSRYDAFYNFISNGVSGEDNGGIIEPDSINSDLFHDLEIPVHINGGTTTHKHRYFRTKQILHLIADSADIGIDVWINTSFAEDQYKYADALIDPASTAYYTPAFLVDNRGIRQYVYQREYQFEPGIALPWHAARSTLSASIQYRLIDIQQEPEKRKLNELYGQASGVFNWIEPLILRGNLVFGIGQADGNYAFKAEGSLNTGLLGKLEGQWSVVNRKPFLVETKLFVNQETVYDRTFSNPFTTQFGVGWNWEQQDLKAGIQWTIFDNYIYFNTDRKPDQVEGSFSLRRFYFSKSFDIKWLGVKGNIYWQPDARAELAIPELFTEASLYGRFNMFRRKATFMPGIDILFHDGYRGISYFPVTGRYHLTEGPNIPEYFRVDAALGVNINFLKAFIRMEDIISLLKEEVQFQADFYPHYRGYLRIGVEAGFFN